MLSRWAKRLKWEDRPTKPPKGAAKGSKWYRPTITGKSIGKYHYWAWTQGQSAYCGASRSPQEVEETGYSSISDMGIYHKEYCKKCLKILIKKVKQELFQLQRALEA